MTDHLFRLYGGDELGVDGYPPVWHETIKHAVREAAGDRCVRCGHPYRRGEHGNGEWSPCDERCTHGGVLRYGSDLELNGWYGPIDTPLKARGMVAKWEHVEAAWRILTVHHLDGNKANCRWWNLVALCQRCHLEIQGRVRMERRFLGEHSDWFKPYVAGYYAHVYLGVDVTRDEAEQRLDELLALEHRQLQIGAA